MSDDLSAIFSRTLEERGLVRPGDRVLVAVSGGADSVALLHLMRRIAPDFPLYLEAAHLDHGLRPESGGDAEFVRNLCRDWGVPLSFHRCEVAREARRLRLGLEETARQLRRNFLLDTANRRHCRLIALGHHRGDQAETVLHRLLRGTGATGLAGMSVRSDPFVRPLLGFSRRQIVSHLEEQGIPWVEDASNVDPAFTRNRIRHALLPHLRTFNPRVDEALVRLGERLSLEEDYWRQESEAVLSRLMTGAGDEMRLDRRELLALHPALRSRVLRLALRKTRGGLQSVSARHLMLVEELIASGRSQADLHLPAAWVGCRYGQVWLRRAAPPMVAAGYSLQIEGAGRVQLPHGGELVVSLETRPRGENSLSAEFDPALVPFPLTVRSFRPGDRIRPEGMAGRKKVKEIFMEARIEKESRLNIPIVEGPEILWIVGLRRCAGRWPELDGPALRLHYRDLPS